MQKLGEPGRNARPHGFRRVADWWLAPGRFEVRPETRYPVDCAAALPATRRNNKEIYRTILIFT
jgi:hypothetical protein